MAADVEEEVLLVDDLPHLPQLGAGHPAPRAQVTWSRTATSPRQVSMRWTSTEYKSTPTTVTNSSPNSKMVQVVNIIYWRP
jgi:hypothetical protein